MSLTISKFSASDIEMVNKFNQVIGELMMNGWTLNKEHESTINQFSFSSYKHSASRFFYLDGHGGTCSVKLLCHPARNSEIHTMMLSTSGVVSKKGQYRTEISVDRLKTMSVGAIVALIQVEMAALMQPNDAVEINPYDIGASCDVDEVNMSIIGCDYKNQDAITNIKVIGFDGVAGGQIHFSVDYKGESEVKAVRLSRYIYMLEEHQKRRQALAA